MAHTRVGRWGAGVPWAGRSFLASPLELQLLQRTRLSVPTETCSALLSPQGVQLCSSSTRAVSKRALPCAGRTQLSSSGSAFITRPPSASRPAFPAS